MTDDIITFVVKDLIGFYLTTCCKRLKVSGVSSKKARAGLKPDTRT